MEGLFSELLKYKRTFMGKLIVFFPLFFAVYALVLSILMQNPLAEAHGNTAISYGTFLASVFNWWSFFVSAAWIRLFLRHWLHRRKRKQEIIRHCFPGMYRPLCCG